MRKWFLALVMALALPILGFAQGGILPDNNCYDLTLSATGRTVMFRNSTGVPVVLRASYYTTGTPAGVSITVEGGNQPAATQTPTTLIAAVTNVTAANMGAVAEQYRYWYVNLGTLAGGSSPTIRFTYCLTKEVTNGINATLSVVGLGAVDAANSIWFSTNAIVFEGVTADAFETNLTLIDPTADRTITLPDADGTVVLSTLLTNAPDAANGVWATSNNLAFEGATADAFETFVTVVDATADRTITLPNLSGSPLLSTAAPTLANSFQGVNNGIEFEGATADAFETTVTVTDPTADRTVTVPDGGGTVMLSSLATNATDAANAVTGASNALVFEGATADAFETSLVPVDPTADQTVSIPNFAVNWAILGSTLTTNNIDAANAIWGESNNLAFEGATADAFESRITLVDPTGDRTFTLDNASGAFLISPGGVEGSANAVAAQNNGLIFEGATADGFETQLTVTDPTADRTVTIPNGDGTVVLSSLATNAVDVANAVTGASNAWVFEGATADAFETSLIPVDPTADQNVSIPNFAVNWAILGSTLTTNNIDAANSIWAISNQLVFEGATADAFETFITATDPAIDTTVTIPAIASGATILGQVEVTFHDQVAGDATDRTFFVATKGYIVNACSQIHSVAAGGVSTMQVVKDVGVTAPGAGTDLLTAAFDLNGAANATVAKVAADFVSLAARTMAVGDKLSVDYANAIQATAGNMVTCSLIPN